MKLSFGVLAVDGDSVLREATHLRTERFTTAVGQLGNDSAAVRLGGVHALAGLADDACGVRPNVSAYADNAGCSATTA